jgi:hypothetical protein
MVAAGTRIILTRFLGIFNPVILLLSCIISGVILPIIFYNLLIKDNVFWFLFSFRKKKPIPAPVPDTKIKVAAS